MPFSKLMYLAAELCLSKILLFCPLFFSRHFLQCNLFDFKNVRNYYFLQEVESLHGHLGELGVCLGRSIAEAFKSV